MFVIPGVGFSPISAVNSASSLTLSNWTGGAVAAGASYVIYRFEGLPSNAVAALVQELLTLGTDANSAYETIDTGAVRFKMDDDGSGNMRMRVRASEPDRRILCPCRARQRRDRSLAGSCDRRRARRGFGRQLFARRGRQHSRLYGDHGRSHGDAAGGEFVRAWASSFVRRRKRGRLGDKDDHAGAEWRRHDQRRGERGHRGRLRLSGARKQRFQTPGRSSTAAARSSATPDLVALPASFPRRPLARPHPTKCWARAVHGSAAWPAFATASSTARWRSTNATTARRKPSVAPEGTSIRSIASTPRARARMSPVSVLPAPAPDQYRYQLTGAASVLAIGFGQRIETANSFDLAGTTATLSVKLANTALTAVSWTAYYANADRRILALRHGLRPAPSPSVAATVLSRYSAQIAIAAAASTGVNICANVGAQTSGTWTIGELQLEAGRAATPFERRPYGAELALCRRYLPALNANGAAAAALCVAIVTNSDHADFGAPIPDHPTAVTPTGIVTSAASGFITGGPIGLSADRGGV